ncbi:MAG: TRAFs-binding domain-containing protein [Opitutales bacterium]
MSTDGNQSRVYQLRNLWLANSTLLEATSSDDCVSAVKQLNSLGDPFSAVELATRALQIHPGSKTLQQQRALAFLRCGATQTARELLELTLRQFSEDAETLSLLGRSYKSDTITHPVPKPEIKNLQKSLTYYNRAWRISGDPYPGINAATIAYLLGDKDSAADLADEIRGVCLKRLKENNTYWNLATLGEANLLLGDAWGAKEAYIEARKIGKDKWADVASTRKQARLILRARGEDLDAWEPIFNLGAITLFTGHLADPAMVSAENQRLRESDVPALAEQIDQWVKDNNVRFGFSSAASGGDLLFLESVIRQGGDAHVILPFSLESFKEICINSAEGDHWESRLNWVLERATSINILNPFAYSGDPIDFEFASNILLGKALLISDQMDLAVRGLSVWDGAIARGQGGTALNIAQWHAQGVVSENIWRDTASPQAFTIKANSGQQLEEINRRQPVRPRSNSGNSDKAPFRPHKETKAILFADVSGYTRLPEVEIPEFVSRFLGLCSELMSQEEFAPDVSNTWGDALFAVFPSAQVAAAFSKALLQEAQISDAFSVELKLRIGLHAGPLYQCFDPIQRCITFTGSHVSLAARLEPIAEEGQIYASEYFAALAKTEEGYDSKFEFLGEKTLDKGHKAMRVYKVV